VVDSFITQDLSWEEKPRERFQRYGAEALSTVNILALIMGLDALDHGIFTSREYLRLRRWE
jgi:DNA repair protein RadC